MIVIKESTSVKFNIENFLQSLRDFAYYDGQTGRTVHVNKFISDGKHDVVVDQDELDIIRLNGEGGLDPEELRRKQDWDFAWKAFQAKKTADQRRKRKLAARRRRLNEKNYRMFGVKI
jgi:hypothetical protein